MKIKPEVRLATLIFTCEVLWFTSALFQNIKRPLPAKKLIYKSGLRPKIKFTNKQGEERWIHHNYDHSPDQKNQSKTKIRVENANTRSLYKRQG